MRNLNHEGIAQPENPRESEIEEVYCAGTENEGIVKSYVQDGVIHVTATGAMDPFSAPTLQDVMNRQSDRYPAISAAEIDFSEVTYIDSMTLGVLIGSHRHRAIASTAKDERAHTGVKLSDPRAAKPFSDTGLDAIFKVEIIKPEKPTAKP